MVFSRISGCGHGLLLPQLWRRTFLCIALCYGLPMAVVLSLCIWVMLGIWWLGCGWGLGVMDESTARLLLLHDNCYVHQRGSLWWGHFQDHPPLWIRQVKNRSNHWLTVRHMRCS
jgi:hypothetical protein